MKQDIIARSLASYNSWRLSALYCLDLKQLESSSLASEENATPDISSINDSKGLGPGRESNMNVAHPHLRASPNGLSRKALSVTFLTLHPYSTPRACRWSGLTARVYHQCAKTSHYHQHRLNFVLGMTICHGRCPLGIDLRSSQLSRPQPSLLRTWSTIVQKIPYV